MTVMHRQFRNSNRWLVKCHLPQSGFTSKEVLTVGLPIRQTMTQAAVQGWEAEGFSTAWCINKGLSVRGMRFAKDVRGQLEALMGRDQARTNSSPANKQLERGAVAADSGDQKRQRKRPVDGRGKQAGHVVDRNVLSAAM